MFVRAIRIANIRRGDWVLFADETGAVPVSSCEMEFMHSDDRIIVLGDDLVISELRGRIVGLVHRPWPEGVTERDILHRVFFAMSPVATAWMQKNDMDEACKQLQKAALAIHETLTAYLLGLPLEAAKDQQSEKELPRNESLVDRHMMP